MIILKARRTNNILNKIQGLIGKSKPEALLLQTRFGIHTWGVKFPIDIAILDKNNKVVKIRKNLSPNSFFFWNPRFKRVLELPQNTVSKKGIKINSYLK